MMRLLIMGLLLPVIFSPGATAQYWAPLQNGVPNILGYAGVVYGDTVWDRLLVGCPAKWIMSGDDTLYIAGVGQWNGSNWDTLSSRIQAIENGGQNGCNTMHEFFRYRNSLYANGSFSFIANDGQANWNFARWNDVQSHWEELECINPIQGMLLSPMVPPQDTMYLTGYRASICGYPESCVFKYDGSDFYPFEAFDAWPGLPGDYVGYVFWFQDQLYMTGLLDNSLTGTFHGFLRYNGTTWDPVPGFETPAPIKDVLIHDNKLYVCGYFFTNTGAPGNMVTVFDGVGWSDMGGGLREALPNGTLGVALDLHESNGDIYVAGQFNYAGGVYAENVARWNGHQWCGMGGHYATQTPGGNVQSLTTWRDTLYIAGGFVTIDGDTMNHVAKWLGEVENCSPSVGLQEEPFGESRSLLPVLIDIAGQWQLQLPEGASEIRVYDLQGRLLLRKAVAGEDYSMIDLRSFPSGIYMARVVSEMRSFHAKLSRP